MEDNTAGTTTVGRDLGGTGAVIAGALALDGEVDMAGRAGAAGIAAASVAKYGVTIVHGRAKALGRAVAISHLGPVAARVASRAAVRVADKVADKVAVRVAVRVADTGIAKRRKDQLKPGLSAGRVAHRFRHPTLPLGRNGFWAGGLC